MVHGNYCGLATEDYRLSTGHMKLQNTMNYIPRTIYIDEHAKKYPLTKKILTTYKHVPQVIITDPKTLIKEYNRKENAISLGKKSLFLTVNKGKFLKKCPGTKYYICCGYQILHQVAGCSLDCSYCILQSYFNNPLITFFTNLDDMLNELNVKLDSNKNRYWRIGTGEFTDSLAFDYVTSLSTKLIPYFMKKKNAILELKTKTTHVDNLLHFRPKGKIVVSWSLNAQPVVHQEEQDAAPLKARIEAARQCQERGYKIGFHFDPIFHYPGWEHDYKKTIDLIFKTIDPAAIAWISLGCFRFIPSLKPIIEKRFPHASFIYHEFIKGFDGKMRYIKPLRIHMYTKMVQWIRNHNSNVFIYLCMESNEVWKCSFGYSPRDFGSLARGLDGQVFD